MVSGAQTVESISEHEPLSVCPTRTYWFSPFSTMPKPHSQKRSCPSRPLKIVSLSIRSSRDCNERALSPTPAISTRRAAHNSHNGSSPNGDDYCLPVLEEAHWQPQRSNTGLPVKAPQPRNLHGLPVIQSDGTKHLPNML